MSPRSKGPASKGAEAGAKAALSGQCLRGRERGAREQGRQAEREVHAACWWRERVQAGAESKENKLKQ